MYYFNNAFIMVPYYGTSTGFKINENTKVESQNQQKKTLSSNEKKRNPFTQEEDEMLIKLVGCYGTQQRNDWRMIASQMKGRTVRQCRERYQLFLNSNIKKGVKWTKEEDTLLLSEYEKIGPHWKKYEPLFHGRTLYNIKNRFRSLTQSKMPKLDLSNSQNENNLLPNPSIQTSQLKTDSHVISSNYENDFNNNNKDTENEIDEKSDTNSFNENETNLDLIEFSSQNDLNNFCKDL